MLALLLTCLVGNIMLAAADECPGNVIQPNFDVTKFAGKWYAIYQPPAAYNLFHHAVDDMKGAPGYEFFLRVVFAGTEKAVTLEGTAKPTDSGIYKVEIPKLAQLNGIYAVVATDYDCYAVRRGCPEEADINDLVFIQFRSENPSDECINKAKEAMKAAGLNFDDLQRDYN